MNIFWEKAARRSGRLFAGLALFAILASFFIFFDFAKLARSSDDEQKIDQGAFNAAIAARYRQVFTDIRRREGNYRRAKESLYPDVFFVPAKSGVEEGLTEP